MSILATFGKVTVSILALIGALFVAIVLIAASQAPEYQPGPSGNINVNAEAGIPFTVQSV